MNLTLLLWGIPQAMRTVARLYPEYASRLRERDLVAQFRLRGETEGRWIRALLILATLTVALVFTGLAANVVLYFSDIILILVMAWLFAFVLSPVVGGIKRYLPAAPRSLVVVTLARL